MSNFKGYQVDQMHGYFGITKPVFESLVILFYGEQIYWQGTNEEYRVKYIINHDVPIPDGTYYYSSTGWSHKDYGIWQPIDEENVPKHMRAMALILK